MIACLTELVKDNLAVRSKIKELFAIKCEELSSLSPTERPSGGESSSGGRIS